MIRLPVLFAVFATVLGCSTLVPQLEKPRLSLARVQLQGGSGVMEQRLLVGVRVVNPNDRELPVKGLDLSLELDGRHVADGSLARSFVVPANSEAEFDMHVTANLAGTLLKLATRKRALRDPVPYRVTGTVATRIGMLRSIPFTDTGTVSIEDLR
jgi:LEA14-like dessication related protein